MNDDHFFNKATACQGEVQGVIPKGTTSIQLCARCDHENLNECAKKTQVQIDLISHGKKYVHQQLHDFEFKSPYELMCTAPIPTNGANQIHINSTPYSQISYQNCLNTQYTFKTK